MRKRLLSILLLCCMVLTLLPTAALAEENVPTFDLTKDLEGITIPADLVTCTCTTTNETKQYGQLTDGFSASKVAKEGNIWTVLISVKPDVYMAQFNKDTGSTHSPDGDHSNDFTTPIQFKLKYEGTKWVLEGEMPKDKTLHFTCNGGHATQNPPVFDLTKDLAGITIPADLVTCVCTKANETKQYGQLTDGFSASKVAKEGNIWTVLISVKPAVYKDQFDKDTGSTHSPDENHSNDFTTPIQFKLKYEENKWVLEGEMPKDKTLHFTCTGQHETPEMPMYPMADNISGLGDQIVAVLCNNVPTDQQSGKYYGLIGGGFTSTTPTLNADKVYESTITLIPSVYCNQFSGDTGIMHKVLSAQTTDGLKFVVKYDSSTKMWKPAEKVKQMAIWVTCDKHEIDTPVPTEFTITFNGNGGTPSVGSMRTTNQKLTSLPTATHSGRYSFDGWYTAASGGTKITTATVFYENTTVYAHWTYIGSGGSSGGGGGGGHTYHTIRAISGLNGSISPSGWTSVRHGWDQTFAITPDKGYAVAKVLVDGKSVGSVKSYTFKNVTKDHTIEVVFMKANGNPQTGVFVDVPEGSYYEEAVDWAVEKGITTGTGNNYFTPDGICTRAQAVTFLWRVAGSPTPKTEAMVFEDVLDGSYYYEAVLWAVENGITVGTSATTFSPELTCSRAHIVTFLWRAANSPSVKMDNPFTDVAADAYYIDAVLWAVKHKITVGTTLSTFSPDEGCTRAQIVTFLYRAHSK